MMRKTKTYSDVEIFPGIKILGLTLWLEEEKTLIFGDLHLGYEEELNALGFLIPRFQYKEILLYLEKKVFSKVSPERIIINGDLKHEFGKISEQEWHEVLGFLDFLKNYTKEIILIKGNHDTILGPLAERKDLKIREHFFISEKKIYLCHGHKIPDEKRGKEFSKAKVIIIAHDHPSLGLREGIRVEKVKCFLAGPWDKKQVIQIPSLNFVTEGSDISQEVILSPFMKNLPEFEIYGIETEKVLYFGKVREIGN